MLYPTPRADRWDPWIAVVLLLALLTAATAFHLLW
jgi:hypothetical protein